MATRSRSFEPSRAADDPRGAAGSPLQEDVWELAGEKLHSRLLLGSSRYPSMQVLLESLEASGTEIVTVAIRRVNLDVGGGENLYQILREQGYRLLPNTAGC